MGNIVRKRIDFRTNGKYEYEEKLVHLSATRILGVHIFQKSLNSKFTNDQPNNKSNQKIIFFIHGVAGSSYIWWNQIEFFTDLNYTVISMDLLGHGSSYRSKSFGDYEFFKLANDCVTLFDQFFSRSGSNYLVGHSYGCSMATFIAHERPNHVNRLILMSGGSSKPLGDPDDLFMMTSCCLWCLHPIVLSVFRSRAFNGGLYDVTDKLLSVHINSWVLKAIILGQVWDEGNTEYHKNILTPTLLIHGEEDQMVIIEDELDMLRAIPKCHLKTIPKVGHMSMLKAPDDINNAILFHITRDWESISTISKPSSAISMINQSSSKVSRSFSLFTKPSKDHVRQNGSHIKEYMKDGLGEFEISSRKTLPSGILIRRKSTRLSMKRASSKRRTQIVNQEFPMQHMVLEEMSIPKI